MPGYNLTRDEAYERSQVITNVEKYIVDIDISRVLDNDASTFQACTEIHFSARDGESSFIDIRANNVNSITLNGKELPLTTWNDNRITLEGLKETNVLIIDAQMNYSRTGEGLHRYVDPSDGEVYLYSQCEVADARRIFPCFEQPDIKSSFFFTVKAPAHWNVFSNEPVNTTTSHSDGTTTWSFQPTKLMSSYLIALVAGPYEGTTSSYRRHDGSEVPLGVYARKSLAQYVDAEEIFDITRRGFEFYEAHYGHPYPFTKYDQVFTPEFNAGAMENAGLVTIVESYVFKDRPNGYIIDRRAITILHELAHMWFGDLVTMKWWDDLWLNESFAEFMSHLAATENTRWKDSWTTFFVSEKTWAISQDQLSSTHPIAANIRDLDDVLVNFDGITYGKGASVLKQLVAWVGQDQFLEGVRHYINKNKWSNATLKDLLIELEKASGRDLTTWTKLWLEEAGVNTLRPIITENTVTNGTSVISSLEILQECDKHASMRPHRLKVAGYSLAHGNQMSQDFCIEQDIDGKQTSINIPQGTRRSDIIVLNDGDLAYAKIRFDETSLNNLQKYIDILPNRLARTQAIFTAWDMCRDGELSARQYITLALKVLDVETDGSVLRVLINTIKSAVRTYTATNTRNETHEKVARHIFAALPQLEAGSDKQLQIIGLAIDLACTDEQFATLKGWLSENNLPDGYALDASQRWLITIALAAAGHISERDIDAEYERETTSYAQIYSAQALAAIPDADIHQRVWNDITGTPNNTVTISNTRQRNLCLGFAKSSAESVKDYAEKYFEIARPQWENNSVEMASNVLEYAFPLQLVGYEDTYAVDVISLGETWLATHSDAPAACIRLIKESLDSAYRARRAQQADSAYTGDFL
ncbi:MAG: aminopeptidase N [Actinomycetaceae bacterium]|nr:aminopeptidase N [Actinomycetaceae bacterium]